jgi:hypothetical protein
MLACHCDLGCVWLKSEGGWSRSILNLHVFGWGTKSLQIMNIRCRFKTRRFLKIHRMWRLASLSAPLFLAQVRPSNLRSPSPPPPSQAAIVGSLHDARSQRPPCAPRQLLRVLPLLGRALPGCMWNARISHSGMPSIEVGFFAGVWNVRIWKILLWRALLHFNRCYFFLHIGKEEWIPVLVNRNS